MARGESVVRGAGELRVKESDRIEALEDVLRRVGIRVRTNADEIRIQGVPTRPRGGAKLDARGDHRIAMLAAVAGAVSREGVEIVGAESVAVSYPEFLDVLQSLALR
jgi:3-phosphoshikimate 1-carboxyvinyltransferase